MTPILLLSLPITLIYTLPSFVIMNLPAIIISTIILLIITSSKAVIKKIIYRYLVILIFLLVIIIGSYDPVFSCKYLYKMFVNTAVIISLGVLIKIGSDINLFDISNLTKVKKTFIIISIIYTLSFVLFYYVGPPNFSDSGSRETCYFNSF